MGQQTESPGADNAGAYGNAKATSFDPDNSTNAGENATALYRDAAMAIRALCAAGSVKWRATAAWAALRTLPDDVADLVTEADSELRGAGPPVPALAGVMQEAVFWAAQAKPRELDSYCLAAFNRMAPPRQAAFLGHVQRRAAA